MRVVDFKAFVELPEGTIFSFWEPTASHDLCRKGDVLRGEDGKVIDFWHATLLPQPGDELDATEELRQLPRLDLTESRWGMFDEEQLFAVYEAEDLRVMREVLLIDRFTPIRGEAGKP